MKQKVIKFLKPIIFKDRSSIPSRFLVGFQSLSYPKYCPKKEIEKIGLSKQRIAIVACSDAAPKKGQPQWGDYWVKYELTRKFQKLGYAVTDENPSVIIHLFGTPIKLPRNTFNIGWIYSHPNWVNPYILKQYNKIFCLSSSFTKKIKNWGFDVEIMIGATNKRPIVSDIKYNIVFVGNTRPVPGGRKIIQDVLPTPYNLKVWGKGWKEILPEKYYGGEYIDYSKLNKLYSSSLIILNDHHQDMAQEGFVPVRIFDILASGGFCVSEKNSGIKEMFGDAVPQYKSAQHLRKLIDFYINDPEERLRLMEKGRKIALQHTWDKRAKQFLDGLDKDKLGSR